MHELEYYKEIYSIQIQNYNEVSSLKETVKYYKEKGLYFYLDSGDI